MRLQSQVPRLEWTTVFQAHSDDPSFEFPLQVVTLQCLAFVHRDERDWFLPKYKLHLVIIGGPQLTQDLESS